MSLRIFSLSIRTHIIFMMISVVLLMSFVVMGYFEIVVKQQISDKTILALRLEARVVARSSEKIVLERNDQLAREMISKYSRDSAVVEAAILLKNSSLLGLYAKVADAPIPQMSVNQEVTRTTSKLTIVEPIYSDSDVIGFVYVHYDPSEVFDSNLQLTIFLTGLIIAVAIIIILFSGYFQRLLTRPVRNVVKRISTLYQSKDFSKRLEPSKDKEITKLTKGFNDILDAAQERENELAGKSLQLKKLVDVRTKQLFKKAHYDTLTGLPNRYLLVDRLKQAISKSKRKDETIALLFLDLDRFKVINDNFGHQNGDQLLKEVAKRFEKIARSGDTVARLGGDEFVFLIEHVAHPKDAARSAMRIIDSLKEPFHLQENSLHLSTSIGISLYPEDGHDDKTLLKNADISMYHAKKKGPGSYSYYSDEMNNASLERLAIEANLRQAIEKNELKLVYQPQKRLKENCYRNVEALLRWENSELGIVSPGVFIPIAEETGLIKKIDLWVISQSCKQIKKWNEQGLTNLTVAINVSAGHLISSSLLEHLKTEIIVNQINASQIEIEITEEVFVEQTERTIDNLKAIKKLGAKIAIDDFGTGYSSLQYIQDFPADTLKLDGMFINKLETDKASQGIVRSTIILAHSLDLEIVAECVEDAWQLDFLEKNNCDIIQGYFLSKPLAPEKIPEICRK